MTRMFTIEGKRMKTWNVFKGCKFDCTYCSARKLALGRLRHLYKYIDGFNPRLIADEIAKNFAAGSFVFIAYMGDIYWATPTEVMIILHRVEEQPDVTFLMMTKNPSVYLDWQEYLSVEFPDNLILGTTIESNFNHGVTRAPDPYQRFLAMTQLDHPRKFVSIEPLMHFHLATMVKWMKEINPEIIEVGADNYSNNLPEPRACGGHAKAPWMVQWLLEMLREFCPMVVEKEGLERLKEY